MASSTVRITGLRETVLAFRAINAALPKVVTDELKKAAVPVSNDARQRISIYPGAKLTTINPRVAGRGDVFVTQGARKRTGQHPELGTYEMRALLDALDEHQDDIYEAVGTALDTITSAF